MFFDVSVDHFLGLLLLKYHISGPDLARYAVGRCSPSVLSMFKFEVKSSWIILKPSIRLAIDGEEKMCHAIIFPFTTIAIYGVILILMMQKFFKTSLTPHNPIVDR